MIYKHMAGIERRSKGMHYKSKELIVNRMTEKVFSQPSLLTSYSTETNLHVI